MDAGKTVRGMVKDPAGKPMAGVKVLGRRQNFVLDYMEDFQLKGTTDGAGQFELPHAAEGDYQLTTEISGAAEGLYTEATPITVKGDAEAPVLTLAAVQGSVIKGRFTSGEGLSLGGREVYASTRVPKQTQMRVKSQADGTFVVSGIPAGASGNLFFNGRGGEFIHADGPDKSWRSAEQENSLNFRQLAVGTYDGIEVKVSKVVHIKGIVRDQNGKPAEKAMVEVIQTRRILHGQCEGGIRCRDTDRGAGGTDGAQ